MVLEDLISQDSLIAPLAKVITALGGIVVLHLGFSIVNFFINRKKLNKIKNIEEKVNEIVRILRKKDN